MELLAGKSPSLGENGSANSGDGVPYAVGWKLFRVIMTNQDGREIIQERVDSVRPGAVKAGNSRRRSRCSFDSRQRRQQGAAGARKAQEAAMTKVNEKTMS